MNTEDKTAFAGSRASGNGLRPMPARWLHVALSAVGLVGWLTFILACVGGPAWSPDSSKLLFAWYDSASGRYEVATYDRGSGKSRIIFQHRSPTEDLDHFNVMPAWENDGKRAIVAMNTGDSETDCTLFLIPIRPNTPPEAYDLGKKTTCWDAASMPQIGSRVYTGGDDGMNWIDLSTGETGSKSIEGGTGFLASHNGELVYLRDVSRPVNDPNNNDAKEDGLEFGRVTLSDDPEVRPTFRVWTSNIPDVDLNDIAPGAWEPGGSRIVMVGPGKATDKILVLDENKGLVQTLTPEFDGVKQYRLGNLVWSRDGETLFASAITKGQGDKAYDYSLAEIPLTGAPSRLTRIASFHLKKTENQPADQAQGDQAQAPLAQAEQSDLSEFDHGGMYLSMAISLSPDGMTIAATPANMDQDSFDAPDHALFLVDMRRETRNVIRIPFPREE